MKTRSIWANLVSSDLERTAAFYTALGFKRNDNGKNKEVVSFSFGQNNFVINFFTAERLSMQMNGNLSLPKNSNEIIFSLSADSKEELEDWAEKVKLANGNIFSEIQSFEKGYTFGFADPDHHKFNFLYWPGM